MAHERVATAARPGSGVEHPPAGENDFEPKHRVGNRRVEPATPEHAVLRRCASHGGKPPGEWPVVGRAHAVLAESAVELLPCAPCLSDDVHVLGVDLADLVHPPHVDQNRTLAGGCVPLRVGHPPAAGEHCEALGICPLDDRRELLCRARLHDSGGSLVGLEADIGREEVAAFLVGDHVVATDDVGYRVENRLGRAHCWGLLSGRRCALRHASSGFGDRLDDRVVAGATTEVAVDRVADLVLVRTRVLLK